MVGQNKNKLEIEALDKNFDTQEKLQNNPKKLLVY